MTKQQFLKRMTLIQTFHSEQQTLSTIINKIIDGPSAVVTIGDYLVRELIEIINQDLGIKDIDLIDWWLYENVEKIIYLNKKCISVKTLEELYDFIVNYEL